ncbi:uncharacterized protein Dmoj_GI26200, isoform B [Drosophila mojavensis]|uniref:Uncharacterized protein, isoform B n=1 Tax=Drosophila mojavensis TaxID=7230 RepID=A0A0Q9XRJ8_DROMO|nr:uncharacterized protein Dmoj_GI26200, isoform B [Drosophila mojavensis]
MEVATIRIQKPAISSEPFKVSLSLTPELMELEPDAPIASEHELKLCKTAEGTNLTGIFSTLDNEEQSIEGWITHKMQCLPVYPIFEDERALLAECKAAAKGQTA